MKGIASVLVFVAILLSSHTAEATAYGQPFPPIYSGVLHADPANKPVHLVRHRIHHPQNKPIIIPTTAPEQAQTALIGAMERYERTNPTGRNHNWCAAYLGMVLRGLGLPTSGSDMAVSYAHYGHPASPAPGVIAVFPHHVGVIVKVIGNDKVELISGNHSHRVGVGVYSMHKAVAWRSV